MSDDKIKGDEEEEEETPLDLGFLHPFQIWVFVFGSSKILENEVLIIVLGYFGLEQCLWFHLDSICNCGRRQKWWCWWLKKGRGEGGEG